MAQLYMLVEDYTTSLSYCFRKVIQTDDSDTRNKKELTKQNDIWFKMEFAEVF